MQNIYKQRGIATILIMLLVGISMMALSMGVIRNVKSTQQKQIAVHATAHVQPLAWTGVELYRAYLATLDDNALKGLKANGRSTAIDISRLAGLNSEVSAELLADSRIIPDGEFEYYEVIALIRAFDHSAQASASLKAVYHVAPAGGNNCVDCGALPAILDFHDDIDIGGGITVTPPAGQPAIFNVDGSVSAVSVSLTSINQLNSTENIVLNSNTFIDELYANGNIEIAGAASTANAKALGDITMSGGTKATTLVANGSITLSGSAEVATSITAQGDIVINGTANQGSALAGGDILIGSSAGRITSGSAKGNIDIGYDSYATGELTAEGNIACPNDSWSGTTGGRAGGSAINCPSGNPGKSAKKPEVKENQSVSVVLPAPLEPFSMEKPVVDVWLLKGYANYIFTYDAGKINVLVKNVNGIDDGNYELGHFPQTAFRSYVDFLCEETDTDGECITPSDPADARTICYGHSVNDPCLTYDTASETWNFNGKSFAPGVMWFEGDLNLGNGIYYNTFMASGNIATSAAHKTYAINYVGYGAICELDYPENKNTTGDFDDLYPTNLCDKTNTKLRYNPVGNLALVAGGTIPGEATYTGGNIDIGASNEINGTILAGRNLLTNGQTVVRGYISATSQSGREPGLKNNQLGGSTSVLLDNLPEGYTPRIFPPMVEAEDDEDLLGKGLSKLMWTRYL